MSENIALTEASYYIMLALVSPQHGYGIMQQTEELSGGKVKLGPGTLYGALTAMVEKGWILPLPTENGSRKKDYMLTAKGAEILRAEMDRLRRLVRDGESILGEDF